ncbi:MAG: NYN domain-containing protein [Candidatus Kapabacteria bacterium]|nr:NYN domain-containing protein [Ignavibacteriota bacterium]MCW5883736.1 NYN domain-containing protein [Candidatus Kapabacteria bacterium]
MKTFILDALNIINKSSDLKAALNKSKEAGISAFCSMLSDYLLSYKSYKMILVIDGVTGQLSKYSPNISLINSIDIIADLKIKELISNYKQKSNLTIVSSDTEVYNFARANATDAMTSENFLSLITQPHKSKIVNSRQTKKNKNKEKPSNASKKEINELKSLFKEDFDFGELEDLFN